MSFTLLNPQEIVRRVQKVHNEIRSLVLSHTRAHDSTALSVVAAETDGDTIYAIDRVSEEGLLRLFDEAFGHDSGLILLGEGFPEEGEIIPKGAARQDVPYVMIVDPIDGTRGLMYDKRSGWILTGVAKNQNTPATLDDIFVAVQTEIPTTKQFRSDSLWAIRGEGWGADGVNVLDNTTVPVSFQPSTATSIEHGFATISRFFPGGKAKLASVEEALVEKLIGPVMPGKARLFEDQYICTAGQFYELMMGHDRFVADLRPLLDSWLQQEGKALGVCCHPYDVCTLLIASEMGVVIETPNGDVLDVPLDTTTPVAWVGYGNPKLRDAIAPIFKDVLHEHGLLT